MIEKVRQYIEKNSLLDHTGLYLVGVSGGADSVCLLLVLKKLGYKAEAVHCNFKLRGKESDRDEQFVASLCRREDIPLHTAHFDTRCYAELHKVSIEMAARQLRYNYFEQLRHDINAAAICVAHHKDDSVETVLMNLLRGTGINGLTGIKPRNGHILRPLLCVSRNEITRWLKSEQQDYVTDSSNLVPDVTRNKIRLEIIPALNKINPAASACILTTAQRVSQAALVYNKSIASALDRLVVNDTVSISALQQEPSPESLLFEWLSPLGFSASAIEQIAAALPCISSGKMWYSPTRLLTVNKGRLIVCNLQNETLHPLRIPETGTYIYGGTHLFRLSFHDGCVIHKTPAIACLDASKIAFPLILRQYRHGDRFCPFGMRGSKSVSDYLTDRKANRLEKNSQLVLTDAHDNIVWLVDQRPDNRFCVSATTKKTLIISHSNE